MVGWPDPLVTGQYMICDLHHRATTFHDIQAHPTWSWGTSLAFSINTDFHAAQGHSKVMNDALQHESRSRSRERYFAIGGSRTAMDGRTPHTYSWNSLLSHNVALAVDGWYTQIWHGYHMVTPPIQSNTIQTSSCLFIPSGVNRKPGNNMRFEVQTPSSFIKYCTVTIIRSM